MPFGTLPGLAGAAGLEPATGRFEGGDSIQLSYAPNADFLFPFGFASRTPGPPSFGSMNSTPAFSRAPRIFSRVSSRPPSTPSLASRPGGPPMTPTMRPKRGFGSRAILLTQWSVLLNDS